MSDETAMRHAVLLVSALSGCSFGLPPPPPMPPFYLEPEEGCIQVERRATYTGRRYLYPTVALHKNGRVVGQDTHTALRKELFGLTQDDPPAHALALTALRSWRAKMAQFGVYLGAAGLMATGAGLCGASIGASGDCPVAATFSLAASGIAVWVTYMVLATHLESLSNSSFHRSIEEYNAHAHAGCPDPPADGTSGQR